MKKHRKLLILALIAAVTGGVIFFVTRSSNSASAYTKETAQRRTLSVYNSFVGNVEPVTERDVTPKVSQQITDVYVKKGDKVTMGQKIAQLDTYDIDYNIKLKQAMLSSTQTTNSYSIADAQKMYDDYKYALDNNQNAAIIASCYNVDSSKQALDNATSAYDKKKNEIESGQEASTQALYADMIKAENDYKNAESATKTARQAVENNLTMLKAKIDDAETAMKAAEGTPEYIDRKNEYDKAVNAYTDAQSDTDPLQRILAQAISDETKVQNSFTEAKTKFDNAENAVLSPFQQSRDSAQLAYNNACASYNATVLQTQQQLATYASNLDKAKAYANTTTSQMEIQNLIKSRNDYTLNAPCDGTVTELTANVGEMAAAGKPIAVIATVNSMDVTIRVDEYSILKASEGDHVNIYVDSIDKVYPGTITWIADSATLANGVSYYQATVSIEGDTEVKSGMSVEVRLVTSEAKNAVTVTSGAVNYRDDSSAYVHVAGQDGKPVERDVTIGISDGTYTEIKDGLAEGDVVLLVSASKNQNAITSMQERQENAVSSAGISPESE